MGKIWETRGGVGKSAILEHKSGIISETHKDRGKDTMEGLQELTNALLKGIIPDPLRPPVPQDWGFASLDKSAV